jgi:hypothetical protein
LLDAHLEEVDQLDRHKIITRLQRCDNVMGWLQSQQATEQGQCTA